MALYPGDFDEITNAIEALVDAQILFAVSHSRSTREVDAAKELLSKRLAEAFKAMKEAEQDK